MDALTSVRVIYAASVGGGFVMDVVGVIVEQLEADGALRTFRMRAVDRNAPLTIALADEYEEPRSGPLCPV